MAVLQDIKLELTPEAIIEHGQNRTIRPKLLRDAERAIALAETLWQPVAVYEWFSVDSLDKDTVRISSANGDGQRVEIRVGPKVDLLGEASQVLVSVGSIGPDLERHVEELQSAGEMLDAYLLDSAGVVALGAVGEAIRCLAEGAAQDKGWGVSPSLGPGSLVGWSMRGQREMCSVLPLGQIGVHLTEHNVLVPHKSASGMIGLGPGYDSQKVGSVCKYCALQKTCWRRREDPS